MKNKKAILETEPAIAEKDNENANVEQQEKQPKKVLNTIINVVLIVAIVFAVIATYVSFVSTSGSGVPGIFGLRLFSIQTDSMEDALYPGDLAVGAAVKDTSELRPGDIITYWTYINGERVLNTHRITEVYDGGEYWIFQTKGDNNTIEDPMTVDSREVIAKYKFRVPGLGKVFDYLQTSTGFLLVVVLPVFIFFIYHLIQFFRVLFEYQNIKTLIKYEQERGRTEDMIAAHTQDIASKEAERAAMEAELREKLRAELLESMAAEQKAKPQAEAEAAEQQDTPNE